MEIKKENTDRNPFTFRLMIHSFFPSSIHNGPLINIFNYELITNTELTHTLLYETLHFLFDLHQLRNSSLYQRILIQIFDVHALTKRNPIKVIDASSAAPCRAHLQ